MAKVFISYRRNTEHDQPLAEYLARSLRAGHQVFIDQTMLLGEDWVRRIKTEVETADFLVLLLSEESIQSSMVVEEVRMAEAARRRTGKPSILPVRVAYEGSLPYDLGAIISRLNYALWRGEADGALVLREIESAIVGAALPARSPVGHGLAAHVPLPAANPRAALEAPEGTMAPESQFYVERECDRRVADELEGNGYTLNIRGPRQMGKSSLLGRVIERARHAGKRVAFVDLQSFGHDAVRDPARLFHQFAWSIEDALEFDSKLDEQWAGTQELAETQRCRRFMEKRILPACGAAGLLLAIDEADSLLDSPSCSDFFGMLRSWHNRRAIHPAWRNVALALVISTEPSMLIKDVSQSPFNVGVGVPLDDFGPEEVARMNISHGEPLDAARLGALQTLLGGHPYLTRKAFYELGKGRCSFEALMEESDSESGPFGDHLRALLSRLYLREETVDALRRGLNGDSIADEQRHRLVAGGLVCSRAGQVVPRNALYAAYFRRVLRG